MYEKYLHCLASVQHEKSLCDHGCSNSQTLFPGWVTTILLEEKQNEDLFEIKFFYLYWHTHEPFLDEFWFVDQLIDYYLEEKHVKTVDI